LHTRCHVINFSLSYQQENKRQILVSGLSENNDEAFLELLFSDKSRSGGGPIETLSIDRERRTALITFETEEGENAFF
jgi:hypothetical protein